MKNYLYCALLAPSLLMAQKSRLDLLPPDIALRVRNLAIAESIKNELTQKYAQWWDKENVNQAFQIALRNPLFDHTSEKGDFITMRGADGSKIQIIAADSSDYQEKVAALSLYDPLHSIAQMDRSSFPRRQAFITIFFPGTIRKYRPTSFSQIRNWDTIQTEIKELDALVKNTYQAMIDMNENITD